MTYIHTHMTHAQLFSYSPKLYCVTLCDHSHSLAHPLFLNTQTVSVSSTGDSKHLLSTFIGGIRTHLS